MPTCPPHRFLLLLHAAADPAAGGRVAGRNAVEAVTHQYRQPADGEERRHVVRAEDRVGPRIFSEVKLANAPAVLPNAKGVCGAVSAEKVIPQTVPTKPGQGARPTIEATCRPVTSTVGGEMYHEKTLPEELVEPLAAVHPPFAESVKFCWF